MEMVALVSENPLSYCLSESNVLMSLMNILLFVGQRVIQLLDNQGFSASDDQHPPWTHSQRGQPSRIQWDKQVHIVSVASLTGYSGTNRYTLSAWPA